MALNGIPENVLNAPEFHRSKCDSYHVHFAVIIFVIPMPATDFTSAS